MDALERIGSAGLVPAVSIKQIGDAAEIAETLRFGGVEILEIPFAAGAAEAIAAVRREYPEMLVGAGAVMTLEQCKTAVACGAAFITSPGFCPEMTAWCLGRQVCLIPGCVTPTEIMAAAALGLRVVGFSPVEAYGGFAGLNALSESFPGVRFLVGGLGAETMKAYAASPFVHALHGDWLCKDGADSAAELCREARQAVLGFELAHIGVNAPDDDASLAVCEGLAGAFGFHVKKGASSNFAGSGVEVMKSMYLGQNGHIAIRTNSIPRAVAELEKHGFQVDNSTAKFKNGSMTAIYLKQEFGGFAVHLLQKS